MGAVLMQGRRPIAFIFNTKNKYLSSLLMKSNLIIALLTAVQKWILYLVGMPFVIKTDPASQILTCTNWYVEKLK